MIDEARQLLTRIGSSIARLPLFRWLSPVESVQVLCPDGSGQTWRGSTMIASVSQPRNATAVMLPERLTLFQDCAFPDMNESDLAAAIALRAETLSPFSAEDGVQGWQAERHIRGGWSVRIAIASRRHIDDYLAGLAPSLSGTRQPLPKDPSTLEVWAETRPPIVLAGFGESLRLQRQRRQRQTLTALFGVCIALAIAVAASPVLRQQQALVDARAQLAALTADTRPVLEERERLLQLQSRLAAINAALPEQVDLAALLVDLTTLLPDEAHLVRLEVNGNLVRMAGFAKDAASLIDDLGKHAMFSSVRSPAPIARTREGLESFSVEVVLTTHGAAHDAPY